MAKNITILHKKSNQTVGKQPKLPTDEQLEYGEIAVNYHKGVETISFKNDDDEIVTLQKDVLVGEDIDLDSLETTAKIIIDESVEGDEMEIYTKAEVDGHLSTLEKADSDLQKEIQCKIIVGTEAENEEGDIFIDESDSTSIDVYSKTEVDGHLSTLEKADSDLQKELQCKIIVGTESENEEGDILIDESDSTSIDVYTKAEVDAIIAKLKADNNLK